MPQLNPLAFSALAILIDAPMHPYEMYQLMLARKEDRVVKVSAGSLYRAVERLARDGLIVESATERMGNRPERTVYTVTEAGRAAFDESLEEMLGRQVNEFPEFPLAVGEAHNLPAERVIELLSTRLDAVRDNIAWHDVAVVRIADKGKPKSVVLNVYYTRAMLIAEADWLAQTIDELRSGALEWPSTTD
ncbi:PadR family transcriptional regulator [Agromyces allii]|uniref:PadR family transcriptional regulator n=1 Tax=Agromyces allii TaxID=393607 RepID=A0ABN2QVK0_9MICO|nr:PadR family transcriptional regulator [Agromyces allii]